MSSGLADQITSVRLNAWCDQHASQRLHFGCPIILLSPIHSYRSLFIPVCYPAPPPLLPPLSHIFVWCVVSDGVFLMYVPGVCGCVCGCVWVCVCVCVGVCVGVCGCVCVVGLRQLAHLGSRSNHFIRGVTTSESGRQSCRVYLVGVGVCEW